MHIKTARKQLIVHGSISIRKIIDMWRQGLIKSDFTLHFKPYFEEKDLDNEPKEEQERYIGAPN